MDLRVTYPIGCPNGWVNPVSWSSHPLLISYMNMRNLTNISKMHPLIHHSTFSLTNVPGEPPPDSYLFVARDYWLHFLLQKMTREKIGRTVLSQQSLANIFANPPLCKKSFKRWKSGAGEERWSFRQERTEISREPLWSPPRRRRRGATSKVPKLDRKMRHLGVFRLSEKTWPKTKVEATWRIHQWLMASEKSLKCLGWASGVLQRHSFSTFHFWVGLWFSQWVCGQYNII